MMGGGIAILAISTFELSNEASEKPSFLGPIFRLKLTDFSFIFMRFEASGMANSYTSI
jgi:hypothetical protein